VTINPAADVMTPMGRVSVKSPTSSVVPEMPMVAEPMLTEVASSRMVELTFRSGCFRMYARRSPDHVAVFAT
jgi:hypothetical protein